MKSGFTILVLSCLLAEFAFAQRPVGALADGTPVFRSEVDFTKFSAKFHPQEQSQWCWAASISSVFNFLGHPVAQERIVKEVFGGEINRPAPSARLIAQQLNREWVDDNGVKFRARLTRAYDFEANVTAITNPQIIAELTAGRPVIICNTHHCMVTTQIDFTRNSVVSVGVFDPWPGKGARGLTLPEMVMRHLNGELTFLGAVVVE